MAELGYLRGDGIELVICKQSTISYPIHNHVSVYTLGFILEGVIELETDRGSTIYREDGAFVILPYAPHCIHAQSCYTLLSLCINTALVPDLGLERNISSVVDFLHHSLNRPMIEEKILKALSGLILLSRMIPVQKETAISKLKAQLETYPEIRYSLDDMADTAFMSKYHLIRTFKHETGLTPHQFQLQNRIRKAQRLLEEPATIAEVALAAGFCDQSHFIRHFEKIVGLTPTDYRLACRTALPC